MNEGGDLEEQWQTKQSGPCDWVRVWVGQRLGRQPARAARLLSKAVLNTPMSSMKDRKWEEGQEGDQLGDPKGSLPDLDVEVHGERPGAHQPFHEVALPVGELGMDGCETADSWLHRLTTLPPAEGVRAAQRSQRGWNNLFLPFWESNYFILQSQAPQP